MMVAQDLYQLALCLLVEEVLQPQLVAVAVEQERLFRKLTMISEVLILVL
jgi:hypothetical protein